MPTAMKISQRRRLDALPRMHKCVHKDTLGDCKGENTWSHPFGRKIGREHVPDEFVICECEWHHGIGRFQDGGDPDEARGQWVILKNLDDDWLQRKFPKSDLVQRKKYLVGVYG